jgi:hypothetical protein
MACSANHSKGSGHGSQHGSGLIVGPNAWLQRKVHLRPQHRGVHLVTEEILRGVSDPVPNIGFGKFKLSQVKIIEEAYLKTSVGISFF